MVTWCTTGLSGGQFLQHIFMQLLCVQIPKVLKDSQVISVFFAHLGSGGVKAVGRTLMKLTPGVS